MQAFFDVIHSIILLCIAFLSLIFLLWVIGEFFKFLGLTGIGSILHALAKNLFFWMLLCVSFGAVLSVGLLVIQLLLLLINYFYKT